MLLLDMQGSFLNFTTVAFCISEKLHEICPSLPPDEAGTEHTLTLSAAFCWEMISGETTTYMSRAC